MRAEMAEGEAALRYPIRGTFVRLLRLGGRAKRKEHGAKRKDDDFFLHVFLCSVTRHSHSPLAHLITLSARPAPFWRNRQANLLGGFEIDHQLELRRLLHRQIGRLGSLQDFVHVIATRR